MGFELSLRAAPAALAVYGAPPMVPGTESAKPVPSALAAADHSGATPELASEPSSFDQVGRYIDVYA